MIKILRGSEAFIAFHLPLSKLSPLAKRTVNAAMQISSAGRALRLPPNKKIFHDFFSTFVTNLHMNEDTSCVG
jgi:hypothetical protein